MYKNHTDLVVYQFLLITSKSNRTERSKGKLISAMYLAAVFHTQHVCSEHPCIIIPFCSSHIDRTPKCSCLEQVML